MLINHSKQQQSWQRIKPENPWILGTILVGLIGSALLFTAVAPTGGQLWASSPHAAKNASPSSIQLQAILHYATSRVVPQQSLGEISVSFEVLRELGPSNFLVFGLGHDSLMWAALNPGGRTVFLEENPKWVQKVVEEAPAAGLVAHVVRYRNHLSQADELLNHSRTQPLCAANNSFLRGNHECRLSLDMLPKEVYDIEWDLIMIDAPRGYFPEAPGRMEAIYSAAVMARSRMKRSGTVTHVFLHDVNRQVEKMYAEEFLCRKHLVKAVGRLWHFRVPPPSYNLSTGFC